MGAFECECGIRVCGKVAYERKLKTFIERQRCLMASIVERSKLPVGPTSASQLEKIRKDIKDHTDFIGSEVHCIRQYSTWSTAMDRDNACIDFCVKHLVPFALSEEAMGCIDTIPPNFAPDMIMMTHLNALTGGAPASEKLEWGESSYKEAEEVVAVARKIRDNIAPAANRHTDGLLAKATRCKAKLKGMLASEEAEAQDTEFFSHYNMQKINALKMARAEAKKLVESLSNNFPVESERPETMTDVAALLDQARLQTVRWTYLAFTSDPEIKSLSKGGQTLRKNLRAAWDLNGAKPDVVKYLGSDYIAQIKTILGQDKKADGAQEVEEVVAEPKAHDKESTEALEAPEVDGRAPVSKRPAPAAHGKAPKRRRGKSGLE